MGQFDRTDFAPSGVSRQPSHMELLEWGGRLFAGPGALRRSATGEESTVTRETESVAKSEVQECLL